MRRRWCTPTFGYQGEASPKGRLSAARLQRPALAARGAIGGWRASVRRRFGLGAGAASTGVGECRVLSTTIPMPSSSSAPVAGGGTLASRTDAPGNQSRAAGGRCAASRSRASLRFPVRAFAQLHLARAADSIRINDPFVEDYPTLPSWTAKTVGGTTVHWTGHACVRCPGRFALERPMVPSMVQRSSIGQWSTRKLLHYYRLAEEAHGGHAPATVIRVCRHRTISKCFIYGAQRLGYKQVHTGYMAINSRPTDGRGPVHQQGFCVQGCKTGAKWSTFIHGDTARRGDRKSRSPGRVPRFPDRAWRRWPCDGGGLSRIPPASSNVQKARVVLRGLQRRRDLAPAAAVESARYPNRAREFQRPGRPQFLPSQPACFVWVCSTSRSSSGAAPPLPVSSWTKPGTIRSAGSPVAITSRWRRSTCRALHWPVLPQTLWGRELAS